MMYGLQRQQWIWASVLVLGLGGACVQDAAATRHVFIGLQRDGVAGVNGLLFASGVGISPDGANVYVAAGFDFSIEMFARGAITGGLGHIGTVSPVDADKITLSPDGLFAYAPTGFNVEVYARNPGTGALTSVELEPANGSLAVSVSPDGQHLYEGGVTTLRVYDRDGITGELTFVEEHVDGMAGVDGLDRVVDVDVSPDGAHVYAAGENDDAIAVFSRNAGTGQLTFVEVQQDGVSGVDGISMVRGARVSPDGKHLYASGVSSGGSGGLAIFTRDGGTGALTFQTYTVGGGFGFGRLAISPDGEQVYVLKNGRMSIFERDSASGALLFEEDLRDNVGGVDGLEGPDDVVVSPDNRHVYVADGSESTVAAFERIDLACSATPLGGCFAPTLSEKALLVVKDNVNDAKDKLVWKWLKGEAVTLGDFGDPATTANDYALCVYDGTVSPQPIAELLAPAGGGCGTKADGGGAACWKAASTKGFSYKRKDTHPDGVIAVKLLAGSAGAAKIVAKAKKAFTPTPAVPITLPVTVQLQNANGDCWTATYSTFLVNENGLFKAKAD